MLKKSMFVTLAVLFSASAFAAKNYEVTITNVTKGQAFTPVLSATHSSSLGFFELGDVASDELAALAESGNIAPLKAVLDGADGVVETAATEGLLMPGASVSFEISGSRYSRLSVAAMLIPTNDSFMALDTVRLPFYGSYTYFAKAYDAGSETNDEICANIPGPVCGGAGPSPDDSGEGFVHISAGISGEADLAASAYDWRDAVAKVTVRRMY